MTTSKKTTVKKVATKKKAPAKKTAPVKKATIKKAKVKNSKIHITLEQRHKMICEAAYYISLERGYENINPNDDWLQAEAAINKICAIH